MRARVLIVEDEPVLALELKSIVSHAGFAIAGCVASVEKALAVIDRHGCDLAVLDANLQGESIEPVAEALCRHGSPFCFISGYDRVFLPERLLDAPRLPKPFEPSDLVRLIGQLASCNPSERE